MFEWGWVVVSDRYLIKCYILGSPELKVVKNVVERI